MATLSNQTRYDVALLPAAAEPLEGKSVIVVDVLRATTTIISALENGAAEVIPQPSIESARKTHQRLGRSSVMGGERQGRIVDGFHHGNSPLEYTPEKISGKQLILATTNGTVAMEACRAADEVLIGAMVNVSAVAERLVQRDQVCVMCSGTDKIITSEDVCFAGAFLERILDFRKNAGLGKPFLTDAAQIAIHHWRSVAREVGAGKSLADFFRIARGGVNLVRIGLDADVVFASQIDTSKSVPVLDLDRWSITLG